MNTTTQYLNERQVSDMTNLALQTLRNFRSTRRGPQYVKVGRSVRYNLLDVLKFMESRKIRTEDEPGS